MNSASRCPTTAELQRLLLDHDAVGDDSAIVRHLGECTHCQQQLEQLADCDSSVCHLVAHIDRNHPDAQSAFWPAIQSVRDLASFEEDSAEAPPHPAFHATGLEQGILDSDPGAPSDPGHPTFVPRSGPPSPPQAGLSFLESSPDPAYLGRLGHFDVARLIGRGGMGMVLEAFDTHLQRTVAVKVLDPQLANDGVSRQRFCREARAAAAISHDHVVTVFQVEKSTDGKLPYLVMQLIRGETLEAKLQREGRLSLPETLRIGLQTAAGLAAAHAQGVIHRDVKPGNILIDESTGRVKLTDFGLARCVEDLGLTRTGYAAGTPLYMSPEQATGQKVDERSDLFSLGAVLYEMCAGSLPFRGNTPFAVLKQITDNAARPVRELNADVPAWLSALIQQLLSKRADERPISAEVVAEEFAKHLAEFGPVSPVQIPAVRTSGACETVKRQHRRHRFQSLMLGLLIGAVVMLLVAIPFLGSRESQETGPVGPEAVGVLTGNAGPVWSIDFTPDGRRLAMAIDDGTVKLWDVGTQRLESTITAHEGPVWATAIAADGTQMVTGHDDGSVHVWDLATEEQLRTFQVDGPVRTLAFAPASHHVGVGTRTGVLEIWDADTGEKMMAFDGHKGIVMHVVFSHDGALLASVGGDKTARIWTVASGRERLQLEGHNGGIYAVDFSADDRLIATGGWDRAVRLWDVASGKPLGTLEGHTSDVWSVAFAPYGNVLASVGEDREVRLWDAATQQPLPTRIGHTGTLYTAEFSSSGQLATAGRDGTARVWIVTEAGRP